MSVGHPDWASGVTPLRDWSAFRGKDKTFIIRQWISAGTIWESGVLYTVPAGKMLLLADVVVGSFSVGELWIYKNGSIIRRFILPEDATLPGLLTSPIRYDAGDEFKIAVAWLAADAMVLLNFSGIEY